MQQEKEEVQKEQKSQTQMPSDMQGVLWWHFANLEMWKTGDPGQMREEMGAKGMSQNMRSMPISNDDHWCLTKWCFILNEADELVYAPFFMHHNITHHIIMIILRLPFEFIVKLFCATLTFLDSSQSNLFLNFQW